MRVTHVITRLIVGGAQENTVASVLGLHGRANLEVSLISGRTRGPEGTLEDLVHRHPGLLTIVPSLVRPVHPWLDLVAWRQLTQHFRSTRPDIVHTHSGKAGLLGRLAAHRAKVPVIVHTIHGPSFGPFQGPIANLAFRAAERSAGRVTSHFVVVAEAMTRQYLAAGIGQPAQYTCIRSGFDLAPFLAAQDDAVFRNQLGLGPDDFVVGMIARLFKLKGHDDLFAVAPELVRRCPRLRFLLVGDGIWRDRFARLAREQGLSDRFIFTGLIPPQDVARYVGLMHVLVHLSRREGLPRSLPQALAAGRPVVAFDCDGAGEVCIDGETGFLLPSGDRAGLVERLLQLEADPDLCARLGAHGRDLVRTQYSVETMVAQLEALYLRLMDRAPGSR